MSRALRLLVMGLLASCGASASRAADAGLERGAAIVDPPALRELDHGRFGLIRIMQPGQSSTRPLANSQLFALPSMAPVGKAQKDTNKQTASNRRARWLMGAVTPRNEAYSSGKAPHFAVRRLALVE